MTCKDCIHYDVCGGYTMSDLDRDIFHYAIEERTDEIPDIDERCGGFKDKSRYIELSCKAGDIIYQLAHGYVEKEIVRCPYIQYLTNGYGFTKEDIGVTVFIGENAKEEAEKAVKERRGK